MYEAYLVLHFLLAVLWILGALAADAVLFSSIGDVPRLQAGIARARSISDRTELFASFFLPLVGVLMLVERQFWLRAGVIHLKILLWLVAIGLFHASRTVLRKIAGQQAENPSAPSFGRYALLRAGMWFALLAAVWRIYDYKGAFGTLRLLQSWFR